MANKKNTEAILQKMGIEKLNDMQEAARLAINTEPEVILLSATGTGKTLAFLLPILEEIDPELKAVQVLILVPSRELAIQIEEVTKGMGSGFKANAIYGGRASMKDRWDLKHPPAILIGTPGRVADNIRRDQFDTRNIKILVLDEFDKSLETGFEKEMKEIVYSLQGLTKKILTSATQNVGIPSFVGLKNAKKLDYLGDSILQLQQKVVVARQKDKLHALEMLLSHLGKKNGIIFCNFKATIDFVSDHLAEKEIDHACFYGGLEQVDRDRALIKFRNGTHRLLLATDLAARGIDVPELDYIIHYQMPPKENEFIHRNGRTARMNSEGTAYILKWEKQDLPEFVKAEETIHPTASKEPWISEWETLFISGGRKDKISKGDIAGLFFKQGNLEKGELGIIELRQDCAFVAVPEHKSEELVQTLNNSRLKKKKVRISILE